MRKSVDCPRKIDAFARGNAAVVMRCYRAAVLLCDCAAVLLCYGKAALFRLFL